MVICAVCGDPLTAPSLTLNVAEYEDPPPLTPDSEPKLADAFTDDTPLGSDTVIEIFASPGVCSLSEQRPGDVSQIVLGLALAEIEGPVVSAG